MRKVSRAEFKAMIDDYAPHLPGWIRSRHDAFVRLAIPVVQQIIFERLRDSGGAYRLHCNLRLLASPSSHDGALYASIDCPSLEGRYSGANYRSHSYNLPHVVQRIVTEFEPRVLEPLDAVAALAWCERNATNHFWNAYGLSVFNAYMGDYERAAYWRRRYGEIVADGLARGVPQDEIEDLLAAFLAQCESWIRTGEIRPQLDAIVASEFAKLKLPKRYTLSSL